MTGLELRAWRLGLDISLDEASDRLDVSRRRLASIEASERDVPAEVVARTVVGPVTGVVVGAEETSNAAAFDPVSAGLKRWVFPAHLPERDWVKHPVGEKYQRVEFRTVSRLFPDPIPYDAPAWAGTDAIVTASGRCFHYWTGAEIKHLDLTGVRGFVPNDGSSARQRKPKEKRS